MNAPDAPVPLPAPATPPAPQVDPPAKTGRRWFPCGCLLGGGFLLVVLVTATLPGMCTVQVKGSQTKALAQAKQIGLALRLYAEDHEGRFPAGKNEYGETIRHSNDAFRSLFPTYLGQETLFANKLSAYQTAPPDNVTAPVAEILHPGENVYSYVMGVSDDKASAATPLVMDGTDGTGEGTYVSDPHARGGVWSGQKAIVIRADNSGAVEILTGPDNARAIAAPLPDGTKGNPLSPAALGPALKLLDPAYYDPAPANFPGKTH